MEVFKAGIPGDREILVLVEEPVHVCLFLLVQYVLAAEGTLEALPHGLLPLFRLFLCHFVAEEYIEIPLDMLQKFLLLYLAEIRGALNEVDMDIFETTGELVQRPQDVTHHDACTRANLDQVHCFEPFWYRLLRCRRLWDLVFVILIFTEFLIVFEGCQQPYTKHLAKHL